jgi:hypothetical protein
MRPCIIIGWVRRTYELMMHIMDLLLPSQYINDNPPRGTREEKKNGKIGEKFP